MLTQKTPEGQSKLRKSALSSVGSIPMHRCAEFGAVLAVLSSQEIRVMEMKLARYRLFTIQFLQ